MSVNFQATAGELALVSRILAQGDPKKTGLLPGDIAVRIFGGAKLPPTSLGEIWAIADEDNRGALSSKGVAIAVRLMGWAQKGEPVTPVLVNKPGPLPTIDGVSDLNAQNTGMSIPRSPPPIPGLPPLTAQDRAKFQNMFNKSGPSNGLLTGDQAREIFVKSRLSNEKLGQIWTLADTHDRGSLDATDFTLAMYLIQGVMSGQIANVPQTLPPGLYQQASGMGGPTASVRSHHTGNSGSYSPVGSTFSQNRIQPQYTGQTQMLQPNLTGNVPNIPARRGPPVPPHLPARPNLSQIASSAFGQHAQPPWDISAAEKAESDGFFDNLDTNRQGYIEGEIAVPFMLESQLPGEDLAQVWDLADINNDGRLTKDGFAVAMYLIKKKLAGIDVPATLPPSLVPPSMRKINGPSSPFAKPPAPAPPTQDSLADLLWDDPPPAAAPVAPPIVPQATGPYSSPNIAATRPAPPPRPAARDPFTASSPFGAPSFGSHAAHDLMGDDDHGAVPSHLEDKSAEIGNAQNQLSSTNRSLETVKADRESTEQMLANQASQLSTLQTQLSSAKAAYETETKLLTALKERLAAQTAEMQTTKVAIISAESDLSAVRVEKAEVEGTLLRDKEDVRELHRRMAEFGQQAESLKVETEKLKKEAKQQRGLLAIARKQLSTKEAEKAKAAHELQEASADLFDVGKEKDEVEAAIVQLDTAPPSVESPPAPSQERSLSSDSVAVAASFALPATPDPSSPGGKSNNPFERLAMASGTTTPTRTGSPFMPFAGTAVPSPSVNAAPPVTSVSASTDPFGFSQAFDTETEPAPPSTDDTSLHSQSADVSTATLSEASPPTSPEGTEDFKTPPTSSGGLPELLSPARGSTLDAVSSKFPALDEAAIEASTPSQNIPGYFPETSVGTDLNTPLKEIEVDDSDSDSDEDEMPLAKLAESRSNGSAARAATPPAATQTSSFDDVFGVSSDRPPSPPAASITPAPALATSNSPFQTSASPFGPSDAFGSPSSDAAKPEATIAGVNAFDEAMGIIPPSQENSAKNTFSFDNAFDDNFDFGSTPAAEPAFPQPPKANGAISPLPTTNDGFDSLFTQPKVAPNGSQAVPEPQIFAASTSAAPAPAPAPAPSFDDVFSGFDTASPPDLGASLTSPPVKAPEQPPVASPFPVSATSPPKSINSTTSRTTSPPPRVSSPTPRPRPSTSSSTKETDKFKEPPPPRHSKLSIRLPFGKKKKQQQQEAIPPPPSQFLTPPAEEPRTGTPAGDDDVESVKQITAMGFSRSQAVEALEKHAYDVPRALNSLLGTA